MLRIGVLRPLDDYKKEMGTSPILFYGVVKVTTLEPNDKMIIANLGNKYNFYHKLILFMKLDTQTYYNIRLTLGLETMIIP